MQFTNPDGSITTGVVLESVDGVPLLQLDLIGNANGYYSTREKFEIVGACANLNNVRVDVTNIGAGGAAEKYVFPPAGGIQMRVVSSNANDTAGGIGIQSVRIHALVAGYVEKLIDVTMNGTTAVLTADANILRINGAHALTVGSSGEAVGDITIENSAGTVVYARIQAGYNSVRNAVYTVPAGKQAYVKHWNAFAGSAAGTHYTRFTLRGSAHDNILLPSVFLVHDARAALNGGGDTYADVPYRFPPTCDIKVSAISDAVNAGTLCNAHFCGWLEPAQ